LIVKLLLIMQARSIVTSSLIFMKTNNFAVLLTSVSLFTSCAATKICTRELKSSDSRALAILSASQKAHGGDAFSKIHDLSVRYKGRWASIGPRFQPILVDSKFRGGSEERLVLSPRLMAQTHTGLGGIKNVLRQPGKIAISYNGAPSDNAEASHAAALVADAYTMFLLGPFYFRQNGTVFAMNGESKVDDELCDEVLAVLRPGLGVAAEDRVILFISRSDKQLRRVRMTLNGLDSTRGAEVEVTLRAYRSIGGVLWPTDFDERVRSPFDLHAHHWNLCGLEFNRGLSPADLKLNQWTAKSAKPTASIAQ
jgi:hypothetical protein